MNQKNDFTKELALINSARVALNMKPLKRMPKGIVGVARWCPVGTGLHAYVDQESVDFHDDGKAVKVAKVWKKKLLSFGDMKEVATPKILSKFIDKFDDGEFPELIRNPEVVDNG